MCELFKKKSKAYKPDDLERVREFFIFCENLESHPFVVKHESGGNLSANNDFPSSGLDTSTVNFDEYHLESLLTRLRQFAFRNELFFYKDLRKSAVKLFGEDRMFKNFYNDFIAASRRQYQDEMIKVYTPNGEEVVNGKTYTQLIESRLYTGCIHSTKRIDPNAQPHLQGISETHIAGAKHLSLVLAGSSIKYVQNIFSFRRHFLRLAELKNLSNIFPELDDFKQRVLASGATI